MLNSQTLANKLTSVIINPLIVLLFAVGLVVFMWGVVEFLMAFEDDSRGSRKEEGKQHMLWGIIGMFVMAAAYSILRLLDTTVGSNVIH